MQVAHRDLKSANILIARDFTAKIADVGELEALQLRSSPALSVLKRACRQPADCPARSDTPAG